MSDETVLALSVVRAVGLAGGLLTAPLPARADDCSTISSAAIAQAKVPYASAIVTSKPNKPAVRSAAIVTGSKLYLQVQATWHAVPYTAQETIDRITRVRQELNETCARVGAEAVDG